MITTLAALGHGAIAAAVVSQALGDGPDDNSVILSLTVNGEQIEDSVLAIRRGTLFYLPVTALTLHRILVPDDISRVAGPGADYVSLGDLKAVTVHFDAARQDLGLQVGEGALERQVVNLSRTPKTPLQPSASGAYLNYDAVAQTNGTASYIATLLDAGTPVLSGDLSSSGILRGGTVSGGAGGSSADFVRLDTAYLREFQDDLTELKIGDSISRAGAWGNPLRFGGLQYGKNFAVQPGFVSYPTANFAGQAALPSTVDVYINDALRYRGDVNSGPFQLEQIPAVTGGGDAQVVVTDLLGRQQVVALPFYVDAGLLRAGISDFSYEAGFLRTDYGLASNRYGQFMVSATQRYGLTDSHTIEGHAEATEDRQAGGVSLTSVFAPIGEFQEEAAAAQGPSGTGWLAGAAFSRQTGPWSVMLRQTWQSDAFNSGAVSLAAAGLRQRAQSQVNLGVSLGGAGSISLAAVRQRYENAPTATVASATWTIPVNDRAFLNAYALNTRQGSSNTTVGLTLTFLFGQSFSGTIDGSRQSGQFLGTAQLRHSPIGETGWDYGATVSAGELDREEADMTRRTSAGDFGVAIDQEPNATSGRLTASGALALVGDRLFAARRLNDAFGLVSVPGYPGVTVYQENRPIGVTDRDGDLFVPTLLSNNTNHIGLATADLPVDAEVDSLDASVTPGYRGIATVNFPVRPATMRLVVLNGPDGAPVEPGIEINRTADGKSFRAGFGGEIYVDGDAGQEFTADALRGKCRFRLPAIGPVGSVPTVVCEPVR